MSAPATAGGSCTNRTWSHPLVGSCARPRGAVEAALNVARLVAAGTEERGFRSDAGERATHHPASRTRTGHRAAGLAPPVCEAMAGQQGVGVVGSHDLRVVGEESG